VALIYFVTPAWKRAALSRVVFEQWRGVFAFLAEHGVEARCVVVADDENADIADSMGFDVLRKPNYALGRKFNDGIEYAARHGADWIVPIGSDSFIDPAYFLPLPNPTQMRSATLYAIAEPNRLGRCKIRTSKGVGPYMIPRRALPRTFRPADDKLKRGVDGSTMKGLVRRLRRQVVDLHPYQYVGFRRPGEPPDPDHPQINRYDKLYRLIGVGQEPEVVERLSEYYPQRLVERALAACEKREIAA